MIWAYLKAMPWITADYLQQTIYVKTKGRVYVCIKILAQNVSGFLILHKVNEKVYLSYLYFTHFPFQVSVTQIHK